MTSLRVGSPPVFQASGMKERSRRFRAAFTRLPRQGLAVIVLSNLDRAALDSIVAGIAVKRAPELMPAALQRWTESSLK